MAEDELMGLRMELDRQREQVEDLLRKNAGLNDELMAWRAEHRKVMNEKAALLRERTIEELSSPLATSVQTILENWMHLTGRDKRKGRKPDIGPGGQRWKLVSKTVSRRQSKDHDPLVECLESVEGYALLPYGPPWKRAASGLHSDRRDDITDIFKDDKSLEQGWMYLAQVRGASMEQYQEAEVAAEATASLYRQGWLGLWHRQQAEKDVDSSL